MSPSPPTDAMTFSHYGVTAFQVQGVDGQRLAHAGDRHRQQPRQAHRELRTVHDRPRAHRHQRRAEDVLTHHRGRGVDVRPRAGDHDARELAQSVDRRAARHVHRDRRRHCADRERRLPRRREHDRRLLGRRPGRRGQFAHRRLLHRRARAGHPVDHGGVLPATAATSPPPARRSRRSSTAVGRHHQRRARDRPAPSRPPPASSLAIPPPRPSTATRRAPLGRRRRLERRHRERVPRLAPGDVQRAEDHQPRRRLLAAGQLLVAVAADRHDDLHAIRASPRSSVQAWTGSAWTTLATVTGNNLVKRTVTFAPFTTDRIRILSHQRAGDVTRASPRSRRGRPAPCRRTTTLASSLNPSTVGLPVTFTATVAGTAPTGNVAFRDGANTITGCSAVALAGAGNSRTAACSTAALAQGTRSITAGYSGDGGNLASTSAALAQVVNRRGRLRQRRARLGRRRRLRLQPARRLLGRLGHRRQRDGRRGATTAAGTTPRGMRSPTGSR